MCDATSCTYDERSIMDPKEAQAVRAVRQERVREMVERIVTDNLHGVRSMTDLELRWVNAVYHPDKRLG